MQRFIILTLVAGLMVGSCILGMDSLRSDVEEFCQPYGVSPTKAQKGKSTQAAKLQVLRDLLNSKKITDTEGKRALLDRITTLESPVKPAQTPSLPVEPEATQPTAPAAPEVVDPTLTCRPPTKTTAEPTATTEVKTDHGTVKIEEYDDHAVAQNVQPISGTKKTSAVHNPDSQTTKLSALGILRSPVFFIGVIGLSALAVITYAYFKKDQKTKNAADDDAQRDKNITQDSVLA
jgi:hypothetical protein